MTNKYLECRECGFPPNQVRIGFWHYISCDTCGEAIKAATSRGAETKWLATMDVALDDNSNQKICSKDE